ncbi:MAG TPA: hypothetical protein VMW10_12015 [Alphaproteobacteria bacterium]|nr:hypothetical protein [Alphaproteobacteria bacterium]
MIIYSKNFLIKSALLLTIFAVQSQPSLADFAQDKKNLNITIGIGIAYCRGKLLPYAFESPDLWLIPSRKQCKKHRKYCKYLKELIKEFPYNGEGGYNYTHKISFFDLAIKVEELWQTETENSTNYQELKDIREKLNPFIGACISASGDLAYYIPIMQTLYQEITGHKPPPPDNSRVKDVE